MDEGKIHNWYPVTSLLRRPIYCNGLNTETWRGPLPVVGASSDTDTIIVLNGEQRQNLSIFQQIWTMAILKVAVDGGANFVLDQLGKDKPVWPDIVTGDFDSVRSDVLNFYKEKDIPLIHTPDQDETDFLKCLRIVFSEIVTKSIVTDRVLVFGAYGGRLDHVFANVNTLTIARDLTSIPVYLLDDNQQAFLLGPGKHHIHVSEPEIVKWCGLVPVSQPVTSKTSGLQWNLDGEIMRYGAIISTSNKILEPLVKIECDGSLLWMMGF